MQGFFMIFYDEGVRFEKGARKQVSNNPFFLIRKSGMILQTELINRRISLMIFSYLYLHNKMTENIPK